MTSGSPFIYLDNSSTTLVHPDVLEAMAECDRQHHVNPASQHHGGRKTRRVLEDTRDAIAKLLGADTTSSTPDRLIFTSGGTEANNLALFGLAGQTPTRIVVSPMEHPSILGPARDLKRRGWDVAEIAVTSSGTVDQNSAQSAVTPGTSVVCLMLANHETGVVQPVEAMAEWVAKSGALLHTDAIQAVGKIPVNFRQLGVHSLSFTAHKFHGPRGIGGLLVRRDVPLRPILFGGFQQQGLRPGTESVTLVMGLYKALDLFQQECDQRIRYVARMKEQLEANLLAGLSDVEIHGRNAHRLPHILNISFLGVDRQALVMALDVAGVAISTGSACQSGSSEASPVLLAMGVSPDSISSSVRVSLSCQNSVQEVEQALRHIICAVNNLRALRSPRKAGLAARQPALRKL